MNIEQTIDIELTRIRRVAWRMDALFYIPRTNISVGLDNILGLVPGVGDIAALIPSLWIVRQAHKLGATPRVLVYMTANTIADFLIGTVPIIGDIFDMLYNANMRNYRALEHDLNKRAARSSMVRTAPKNVEWVQSTLLGD